MQKEASATVTAHYQDDGVRHCCCSWKQLETVKDMMLDPGALLPQLLFVCCNMLSKCCITYLQSDRVSKDPLMTLFPVQHRSSNTSQQLGNLAAAAAAVEEVTWAG